MEQNSNDYSFRVKELRETTSDFRSDLLVVDEVIIRRRAPEKTYGRSLIWTQTKPKNKVLMLEIYCPPQNKKGTQTLFKKVQRRHQTGSQKKRQKNLRSPQQFNKTKGKIRNRNTNTQARRFFGYNHQEKNQTNVLVTLRTR